MVVDHWFSEVGSLSDETVIDILTSLTNYSLPDFAKLFNFLLQQARIKALGTDTHENSTLKEVKTIVSKDVDACHSPCTAGRWHVCSKSTRHFNVFCLNCEEEGYSLNWHPQPKDQKKLATKREKFSKQEKNGGGTIDGNKSWRGDDSSIYNQNQWGAQEWKYCLAFWKEAFVMVWKEGCGWNTTHTTSFHNAYKKKLNTFHLPETHPYMKSLNELDEALADIAPASLTSGIYFNWN